MCFQKKHVKLYSGTNITILPNHGFLVRSSGVPELLKQRSLVLFGHGWVMAYGSTLILAFWLKHSRISSLAWALCAHMRVLKLGKMVSSWDGGIGVRSLSVGFKKSVMMFRRMICAIYFLMKFGLPVINMGCVGTVLPVPVCLGSKCSWWAYRDEFSLIFASAKLRLWYLLVLWFFSAC